MNKVNFEGANFTIESDTILRIVLRNADPMTLDADKGLVTSKINSVLIDPNNPYALYISTKDGLYVTVDGLQTLNVVYFVMESGDSNNVMNCVLIDNTLYVCTTNNLYKSTTNKLTYDKLVTKITDIDGVLFKPTTHYQMFLNNGIIYIATSHNIIISKDGGLNWIKGLRFETKIISIAKRMDDIYCYDENNVEYVKVFEKSCTVFYKKKDAFLTIMNHVSTIDRNSIYLQWDKNYVPGYEVRYKIFRDGLHIKTLDSGINSYIEENLMFNRLYNYTIQAFFVSDVYEIVGAKFSINLRTENKVKYDNISNILIIQSNDTGENLVSLLIGWNFDFTGVKAPPEFYVVSNNVLLGKTKGLQYLVPDVPKNTDIKIYVYTIDALGQYTSSDKIYLINRVESATLDDVKNLKVTVNEETTATIIWDEVENATSYEVFLDSTTVVHSTVTDNTVVITDLIQGTEHMVCVRAKNDTTVSKTSGIGFTTKRSFINLPSVENLLVEKNNDSNIIISWDSIEADQGFIVYEVYKNGEFIGGVV